MFRSIVVFGTAMGAGTCVVAATAGCDLYFGRASPHVDAGQHGIIDASNWGTIADGPWGIIDASLPIDGPPIDGGSLRDAADAHPHEGLDGGDGSDA